MQPPEFRGIIAVLLALIMTSIIGYFWIGTISRGTFQRESSNAPSPFNSLIQNISDVVKQSKNNTPPPVASPNRIQVIDESSQKPVDMMYDESNPASQY